MSVVTVARGGHSALAFIKGSPEMVASLCRAETGQRLVINNIIRMDSININKIYNIYIYYM